MRMTVLLRKKSLNCKNNCTVQFNLKNESISRVVFDGMKMMKKIPKVSDWSLENGYKNISIGENEYPIRVGYSDKQTALDISMLSDTRDLTQYCKEFSSGFKVILTTPGESFEMSRNFFRVPLSAKSTITVNPILTTTSDALRNYFPMQRKCFYNSERQLRFFKFYSKSNCEAECLTKFINDTCGCVKFFMPSMTV